MQRKVEYAAKCLHPHCRWARNYGAARLRAELEAGKHARRYDWHEVEVRQITVLYTFSARDNQLTLSNDDEIPF